MKARLHSIFSLLSLFDFLEDLFNFIFQFLSSTPRELFLILNLCLFYKISSSLIWIYYYLLILRI